MLSQPDIPTRVCLNCARAFSGKAGRMIDGAPVCPSCAPRFNTPEPCSRCGRTAKVFGRDRQTAERVCRGCLQRETHATCANCRKHRKIAGAAADGRPLCAPCAAAPGITHPCPGCGVATPGAGAARCTPCATAAAVIAAVDRQAGLIRAEWARAMLRAACAAEGFTTGSTQATRAVARIASDIRALEAAFPDPAGINQAALLAQFGAEGCRRKLRLMRFLARDSVTGWSVVAARDFVEGRRLEAILSEAEPLGHRALLEDFLAALDPELAARSRRSYLRAALGFLESLAGRAPKSADDARLMVFLRARPGQRAAVGSFVRFLRERLGAPVATPRPRERPSQRTLDRRLLRRAGALLEALRRGGTTAERRSWLAALLAELSGARLEAVLAAPGTAFADTADGGLSLATPRGLVPLPSDVAGLCRELAAIGSDGPAFAGRYRDRPLHALSVRHHVAKLGLPKWRRTAPRLDLALPYPLDLGPRPDS